MCTEINYNFDVVARGKISKIRCPPGRYGKDIWLSALRLERRHRQDQGHRQEQRQKEEWMGQEQQLLQQGGGGVVGGRRSGHEL